MRVRLRDVAEQAGVSQATASRVLNQRPGPNALTRERVLRVMADLGYAGRRPPRPYGLEAGLVGLMVPELENPIFPAFAQSIESRLASQGYTAVLCSATQGGVTELDYVEMLRDRAVSGIVVVSGMNADTLADHSLYESLRRDGIPVVFINGMVPSLAIPTVSCDDGFALELAVRHLASMGHRSIGLAAGPSRYQPVQRKVDGFRAATALRELRNDLVAEAVFSVEGGHVAARQLIALGATAIVSGSDLMALGAVRAARDAGQQVPHDVSVIGFDDTPLMAYTDPPLTTVRQPVRAMSEAACRTLIDLMTGIDIDPHEYLFRPELVVRGSTGPAPRRTRRR